MKSVYVTLKVGLWTALCSFWALWEGLFGTWESKMKMISSWYLKLNKMVGINLHVTGKEKVPDKPVLFVFNHLSLLDIPIALEALPRFVYFGAKIELFRIPIFGHAMKRWGVLAIKRTRLRDVIKVYSKATKRFEKGDNFILAAEGTRQSKVQLGEFKSGPFILAIQGQVPVVPVVINGAEAISMKTHLFFKLNGNKKVRVQILDPIETNGLTALDRHQLKDKVREKMLVAFEQGKKEIL